MRATVRGVMVPESLRPPVPETPILDVLDRAGALGALALGAAMIASGCARQTEAAGVTARTESTSLAQHGVDAGGVQDGSAHTPEYLRGRADFGSGEVAIYASNEEIRRPISPDELARFQEQRAAIGTRLVSRQAGTARSMTDRAIERAASSPKGRMIEVGIELAEQEFAFGDMRSATDPGRASLIAAREAQLKPAQDELARRVVSVGGHISSTMWLVNLVDAVLPMERVAEVASWPGVRAISVSEASTADNGWRGTQIRAGLQVDGANLFGSKQDFYQGCFATSDPAACHDANTGHWADNTKPVRIAIVESGVSPDNMICRNHVGWLDAAGGASRLKKVYACNSTSCSETTDTCDAYSHGTEVAWAAAGSIEQGQDSNFPLSGGTRTSAQRDRSGVAKEAAIYFYLGNGSSALRRGIERAVTDGADVINMSWHTAACDDAGMDTATYDSSSMNAALRNALNAGALPIKSAGNGGHAGTVCTLTYPGWRPDVLAIGGLNSTSRTTAMEDLGLYGSTSRGGATLEVMNGGGAWTFSGIALMAPACIEDYFHREPNGYNLGDLCGTSFAAPIITGTAALLRDALDYAGFPIESSDPKMLMATMLVFGDGWEGNNGTKLTWGLSDVSGYGRTFAHWPSSTNLSAPWLWTTETKVIHQDELLQWNLGTAGAESTSIEQWKWAVTWFESDLSNMSDIVIQVVDTCAGNAVVRHDLTRDFRKRIHLRSGEIGGKCLAMQAFAYAAPANGKVLYSSNYYHSGDADHEH